MKRATPAVVIATIALIATIVLLNRKPSHRASEPLAAQPSSGLGQPLRVGEDFSVGTVSLGNGGKVPAKVERVRVLGVTGPLELLGVRVRHLPGEPGGAFLGVFGFPPPEYPAVPLRQDPIVPVATERTESGDPLQQLQLLIGVRATAPGIARYRAVEVTYSVRGIAIAISTRARLTSVPRRRRRSTRPTPARPRRSRPCSTIALST